MVTVGGWVGGCVGEWAVGLWAKWASANGLVGMGGFGRRAVAGLKVGHDTQRICPYD